MGRRFRVAVRGGKGGPSQRVAGLTQAVERLPLMWLCGYFKGLEF